MASEKHDTLLVREAPRVVRLRHSEIPRAVSSWLKAFENDPLQRYITMNKKPSRPSRVVLHLIFGALIWLWIRRKIVLTVGSGEGITIATTPSLKQPSGILDRICDWLAGTLPSLAGWFRSEGATKKRKGILKKIAEATERTLGDRVNDMVHVDGLATDPACQGRGYGGALLDAVTSMADASSRSSFLESSNVANTAFYMSHGFMPIADVLVGDDDPEWNEPPLVVKLMVREFGKEVK